MKTKAPITQPLLAVLSSAFAIVAFVSSSQAFTPSSLVSGAKAQDSSKSRIVVASGVRVRKDPDTNAGEVSRLPIGAVVEELDRSPGKAKVGSVEDYWYLVSAPGGSRGWVFGGLTAPFDAARREEIYLGLTRDRLANESAPFADMLDLVRFLDGATKEVARRDLLAELQLARLQALARSLAAIPAEQHDNPTYKNWTTEREREIVYSEPAGQWFVRADLFWDLQKKYKDLPIAERIAWEGAQTPLPGECEGYLPCTLFYLSATAGKYLQLYPHGAHADAALDSVGEEFKGIVMDLNASNPVYQVPTEDRAEFRKTVAALRAELSPVANEKSAQLLKQLDEIERRFR